MILTESDEKLDEQNQIGDDNVGVHTMPESFVAYCLAKLSVSESPWTEPTLVALIAFVAFQQLVMVAFAEGNNMRWWQLLKHWGSRGGDEIPFDHCMMADRIIHGDPLMTVIVGFFGCFMVSLAIRADTAQYQSSLYPRRDDNPTLWCVVTAIWLVQTIYMPGIFCLEATVLLASSEDSIDILMNCVAATFLLEMDDVVYSGLLREHDREEYQAMATKIVSERDDDDVEQFTFECAPDPGQGAPKQRRAGRRLSTNDVCQSADRILVFHMLFMMFGFVALRTRHDGGFMGYLGSVFPIELRGTMMLWFVRSSVQLWEWDGCSSNLSRRKVLRLFGQSLLIIPIMLIWSLMVTILITGSSPLFAGSYSAKLASCLGVPASTAPEIANVLLQR